MYNAEWKGEFEGYSVNFLTRNYWRVAKYHDRDDALQECALVFLRCKARYQVESGAHFMALFKRMLDNHWHTLSTRCSSRLVEVSATYTDEDGTSTQFPVAVGSTDTDAPLLNAIQHMPVRVRSLLAFCLNGPDDVVSELVTMLNAGPRDRKEATAALNSFLGLPNGTDVVQEAVSYFLGT